MAAPAVRSLMIVVGSRLKLKGNCSEVMFACPSAWMGEEDTSTWSMSPKNKSWKVAFAVRSKMLMLAVNGLASAKELCATPVCTMSVGNTKEALVIKFWCKAGMVAAS